MSVLDALRESVGLPIAQTWYRVTGQAELAEVIRQERAENEHLRESVSDLQNRLLDPHWRRMTTLADEEFTRDGLRQMTLVCRVMALKNPLIRRGLGLRVAYVWGQGVNITARAPEVDDVIQKFLADPSNRRSFSGDQAHETLERSLGTDGNVFLALFTNPRTGRVQVRQLPWDEISDILANSEDGSEPRFYRRDYWADRIDPILGARIQERKTTFYPALGYRPAHRPRTMRDLDGAVGDIMWDAPVYHVQVGGHAHWRFGIPDAYAALDWANAYREFLTDWARLVKSLSRFAWKLTSRGSRQAAAKARMAAGPATDRLTGDAQHAGATAVMTPDMALEAVPKSGATIDSESGRPIAAMAASAMDVPVTMLLGDPGVTGARATAETLDTPTERTMELRRGVWGEAQRAILAHVLLEAVRAPEGPLYGRGTITHDAYDNRETLELADDLDATIDISWPDIDDIDVGALIDAIVAADGAQVVPRLVIARMILETFKVKDVDSILAKITDENGNFAAETPGVGQAAADQFRAGQDPAAAFGGQPAPAEEPLPVEPELEPVGAV
ncbi:hypothetical protein [Streptosporangium sp. NPDC002721]|uniref:hypothetical protein n=1 Tax=Streptosporangium sp. NPDC002721 TaxID=3366188 RepID=UPI0036985BB6